MSQNRTSSNKKSHKTAVYAPPPVPSTKLFKEIPLGKVPYPQPKNDRCQFSYVPYRYKFALRRFKFLEWKEFNKHAAKVWAGHAVKQISQDKVNYFQQLSWVAAFSEPEGEEELRSKFDANVLEVLNLITDSSTKWSFGKRQRLNCDPSSRVPDISCRSSVAGSSSSQTRDNMNLPIVNGEMKVPSCLDLGSGLTADWLQRKVRASNWLDNEDLNPFFQALSYGLYTSKGLAFLTNYDIIRYFKISIGAGEILMSSPVKIDQVLDEKRHVPHAAQTLLYMGELEYPDMHEYSGVLANDVLDKGDREAKEYEKKKEEEKKAREKKEKEKKSSRGSSSTQKGSSSGDRKGKKHAMEYSHEIFTPVSRVLQECKVIGSVGIGVTGEVSECDYNGLKVAVKVGQKMSYKDERDCFFHVKHEVKMYEVLKELQGRIIPRLVIAGLERYYTPSAMVLITEKVGMCVVEGDDKKIYVSGRVLDEENLMLLEEKGLEGLRALHSHGVVHYDTGARNTRVEMRDGKISRVWWIDFGDACEIDEEAGMVWDVEGHRGDYPKGVAIDLDVGVFRRSIGKALEAIES